MRLFSGLYARVMIWARHKYATYWLALVSFTESSCFLVPPDVMLAPMTLARPERAWFLAMLTTVTSVLGGLLGYFIGLFAFNMAEPLLISLGYMDA
ncbi:YqaA family protein, partial [Methylophaga sp. UBA5088]